MSSTTRVIVSTSTTTRPLMAQASAPIPANGLLSAAYGGTVKFGKERASGTVRHWPVLAPGSEQRNLAEQVEDVRRTGGTVEQIAKERNVSVPTVRRLITALAFTRELEAMPAKERQALAKRLSESAPKEQAKKAEAPKEQAPKAPAKPKAGPKQQASKAAAAKARNTAKATEAAARKAAEAKASN